MYCDWQQSLSFLLNFCKWRWMMVAGLLVLLLCHTITAHHHITTIHTLSLLHHKHHIYCHSKQCFGQECYNVVQSCPLPVKQASVFRRIALAGGVYNGHWWYRHIPSTSCLTRFVCRTIFLNAERGNTCQVFGKFLIRVQ